MASKLEAPKEEASEAAMDAGTSGSEDEGPTGTAEEELGAGPAVHCKASDVSKTDVQKHRCEHTCGQTQHTCCPLVEQAWQFLHTPRQQVQEEHERHRLQARMMNMALTVDSPLCNLDCVTLAV